MNKVKTIAEALLMKGSTWLAAFALLAATFAANSACFYPFYEPEQPEELESLKKWN